MILINFLSSICRKAFEEAFPLLNLPQIIVTPATKSMFGHYQCNDAMKLAKTLNKSPRVIAEKIVPLLQKEDIFEEVSIAGLGFINLSLSKTFLSQELKQLPQLLEPGALIDKVETIIVEFSSPNVAKEMHVGHLRSTIIGDSIAKIFEFLGHNVIRLNHIGDWGTSFGMLITYLIDENLQNTSDLAELTLLYKKAKQRFDEDENFKQRSRQTVVALQHEVPQIINLWKNICQVSRKSFQDIYSRLNVYLEERGESFYNSLLPDIVEDLKEKQLAILSEGAWCIFHEGISSPLMVQKQDGGYNYDTTDMAAMYYRVSIDNAQRIIIVTDAGQALHFELVKKTAQQAGYLKDTQFDHVTFGLVLNSNKKKFKTRSGETIKLLDLLNTAIEKAAILLLEHDPHISQEDLKKNSKVLGINAIKYADLSTHRISDYIFSFDKMLRFEGNTATFILYSYVRIYGLKRFLQISEKELETMFKTETIHLEHPSEVSLAVQLLKFPETVIKVSEELTPHLIANYLYLLAEKFNAFFRDCRVQGSDYQTSRILLAYVTEKVFALGAKLLGLELLTKL